ncbi:MAG: xylulokinase [Bauldia sp.]|nr:xylulokinase [Bauldia sp.]
MYLGIDIGTSSVKAVLIGDSGEVLSAGSSPLTVLRPRSGWSEQDPKAWLAAVEQALSAVREASPDAYAAARGIGLSGQMHGATVLGADDEPLAPAILWNDVRAADEAALLDADPAFREITGNIVFPGFTAPKLLWLQRHRPETFSAMRRVLLPKDFVRLWLSGEAISDMSDASGTAWLDVGRRQWSKTLLEATGMVEEQMPSLAEGTAQAGALRPSIAERLGLPPGIPIAGGAGDNAASACGVGAVEAGAGFVSLGTSGVLFVVTDRFLADPQSAIHAFCHALPGKWHQMGVILSAAASLEWLAGVTGAPPGALVEQLGDALAPPSPVTFLPYLGGERTPHNDASIRGAFAGLDLATTRNDLTRSVVEGVAFALRDSLNALLGTGARIERLTIVGGGARSRYWSRLLATVLDLPIAVPADGDFGAAFGAARLGLIAATGADPAAVCTPPAIRETVAPEPALVPAYEEAHARFRRLYPALKGAGR